MNPYDIHDVLVWWFVLFAFGVFFLPVTFRLFAQFFDNGYLFSRLIGLLFVGYAVFLMGTFRFAPFTNTTIIATTLILSAVTFIFIKPWGSTWLILKNQWIIFAIEEILFLAVLLTWAYVHSFAPDIHGLEKFMDFGFINSLLRSEYFPPKDMWFTPFTINYYYFGHLLTALLTKVSGLPSYITFNLMLSTIVATCFSFTFSIGANLYRNLVQSEKIAKVKLVLSGILTACLVTFAGNLHILYAFFKPYNTDNPVPMWQLPFAPMTFPNSYWYPNATRFIYHTIHEFPIYSWTVADLHGHVLDIPFVLLIIAFLFSLLLMQNEADKKQTIDKTFIIRPAHLLFIGLLLSAMYMANAWDGAIYWLLTVMTFIVIHGQKIPLYTKKLGNVGQKTENKQSAKSFLKLKKWQVAWLRDICLSVLVITAGLLLFATPYNLYFDTSAYNHGIGVICAPDFLTRIGKIGPFLFEPMHCQRSYWWELLTLYGFFYFFVAAFGVFIYRTKKYALTDIFVILLILLSSFLIIIPEFFYLKDIYPTYYRANTMFKLVFQAFIMLQICSAYIIVRMAVLSGYVRMKQRIIIFCFLLVSAFLVGAVMIYPFLAVPAYYNDFRTYDGLNGIGYLKTLYPDDYLAIMWLNQTVSGQPVILEAQGDSYTDYARISANTGLPTVLGWTVHEWLWRGSYDVPAPRINDVENIYMTTDIPYAKELLNKYNVQYVYVGTLEYQKYPHLDQQKFLQLGHIVYHHGTTTIYKLN